MITLATVDLAPFSGPIEEITTATNTQLGEVGAVALALSGTTIAGWLLWRVLKILTAPAVSEREKPEGWWDGGDTPEDRRQMALHNERQKKFM